MRNRRTFMGVAAASLLPVGLDGQSAAQAPAPRPSSARGELARHALAGPFEGFEALVIERDYPALTVAHRHPGIVLGYVVDGQLRFALNKEPERIISAGGTFFEPAGGVHTTNASANPDVFVRVLVFMVVPKGSPPAVSV